MHLSSIWHFWLSIDSSPLSDYCPSSTRVRLSCNFRSRRLLISQSLLKCYVYIYAIRIWTRKLSTADCSRLTSDLSLAT
jgi:hypothetical protein